MRSGYRELLRLLALFHGSHLSSQDQHSILGGPPRVIVFLSRSSDVADYSRSAKQPEWWRSFRQRLRRSRQCPAPLSLQVLLSLALPPLSCLSERKAEFHRL